MNLSLILKRTRREWRQLGVLVVAMCLVTAFFALGPLYARAMIQSGLQHELASTGAAGQNLTFISQSPYGDEAWPVVNDQLGAVNAGLVRIARSAAAFGGFEYVYGEPTDEFTARSEIGYRVYAFSNLHDILKLIDGRWPDRLPPPDSPERAAASPEEQVAKGLGIYSRGDVEAVITPVVARKAGLAIGSRVAVGESPQNRTVVKVVGLVEAVNPDDPIWEGNDFALTGEESLPGVTPKTYNMGFFVTEGAYSDWMAQATTKRQGGENNTYIWLIRLNGQAINADNVDGVRTRLAALAKRMEADYPGLITLNPLLKLLNNYAGQVANAEGPVILLSGAILVLMLYHLVTTVGLALEQQMGEWASLSSRGASTLQLIMLQALTMILLGVIGFGVGPFLALLILGALTRVGPLAASTGALSDTAPIAGIPASAFALSGIAAVASIIALTLPALPAARRSLAQFKQIVARPPSRPAWARYWLDLVLILCGVGFLARLLFFVSGDLRHTLSLLANNPRGLIQLILDSANQTGGLSDPLNLAGPALLLTGIALFWLRLFPGLIRLVGGIFTRRDNLTGPLAVWNVERDPGHYAQLVLLLIGTLALGTAALALGSTRDVGAWAAARLATGGAARIELDRSVRPDTIDWLSLPGVSGMATLTRAETEYQVGQNQIFLVGVNPGEMAATFPETADSVKSLVDQQIDQESQIMPVVMSARMAQDEGRATRPDRQPLEVGATGSVELPLPGSKTTLLNYRIVGVTRSFPSLADNQHFLILDAAAVAQVINAAVVPQAQVGPNQVWLEIPARELPTGLNTALHRTPGVTGVTFAWDRYNELLREPLPAAVAGMLYAGFWVSLLLSLLDFGFYLAVTARRRSLGFAVLQALGWNASHIWALLAAEQAVLILPALLVGMALGAALAYVILPFLALVGGETLRLPVSSLLGLLIILLAGFGSLLSGTAWWLRRLSVNQVLRLGEE